MGMRLALLICCALVGCVAELPEPLPGRQDPSPAAPGAMDRDHPNIGLPVQDEPVGREPMDGDEAWPPPDFGDEPGRAGAPAMEPRDAGVDRPDPPDLPTGAECIYDLEGEPRTLIVPRDYLTIQAAVNAAQPLDTVLVEPGTYTGSIQLKTGVRLIGSGAATTILDGRDLGFNLIDFTGAHDVVVSGFTLRNVGQAQGCARPEDPLLCAGPWYAAAVFADGHSVVNDSEPCNDASIVFSDNVVTDNEIGVMIYFQPYAVVRDNVFIGNRAGFVANNHGGATALVTHNVFIDNEDEAIAVQSSYLDIVNNVFVRNGMVLREDLACQEGHLRCNVVWNNVSLGEQERPFIGVNGNVEADPLLVQNGVFYTFADGSPVYDVACAGESPPRADSCGVTEPPTDEDAGVP